MRLFDDPKLALRKHGSRSGACKQGTAQDLCRWQPQDAATVECHALPGCIHGIVQLHGLHPCNCAWHIASGSWQMHMLATCRTQGPWKAPWLHLVDVRTWEAGAKVALVQEGVLEVDGAQRVGQVLVAGSSRVPVAQEDVQQPVGHGRVVLCHQVPDALQHRLEVVLLHINMMSAPSSTAQKPPALVWGQQWMACDCRKAWQ